MEASDATTPLSAADVRALVAATAAERAAAAAERAAAAAERETLLARLADALADAALARQLAAVRLADPPQRIFAGVSAALRDCAEELRMPSPSKMTSADTIQASLAAPVDLGARPLSPLLAHLAAAPSLERWRGLPSDDVLGEESGYPIATAYVPSWIVARERAAAAGGAGSEAAHTLFLGRARAAAAAAAARPSVPGFDVQWACFPELLTAVREPFHPAFNGEVKPARSAGDTVRPHMFDELLTYLMLGMLASYFRGVPTGAHRFFREPPHAFGLLAFPHVGYLVAVEWAGKLFASIVSEPFFLGSAAHEAAIARLPDSDLATSFLDLAVDSAKVAVWPHAPGSRAAVIWRLDPPARGDASDAARFFKIVRGTGFDGAHFRRLHAVYRAYAAARAAAVAATAATGSPPLEAALVDAELWFGAGEVCVLMPWVFGRDATPDDLAAGGCAVVPVARAIVWLARRGLLYTDLREPNVRVDVDGAGAGPALAARVTLIDYDDCVLVDPPATADALLALLAAHGAGFAAPPDAPRARPAVVAALRQVWLSVG